MLVLLLCVVGVNVPFLNQAFHMDDGIYLLLAHNVDRNPWFPQDRSILFEGLYGTDLASTEHPWPFTSYLMALCGYIGGFSESCLHLGFLVFPIVLACSMYAIARRHTHHPALASMTVLALPVVCVLSHTLMTDVPLLALWVASVALFSRGVDSGRMSLVWLGTAVGTLGSLVSYSGFCLVLLLALYGILWRKRAAVLTALIVPVTVFAFWVALNYFHYHRVVPGLLLSSYFFVKRVLSPGLLMQKSAYIVISLGGVTIFPFFLIALSRKLWLLVGFSIAIATSFGLGVSKYDPLQMVMFLVFFCAGFVAIIEVVRALMHSLAALKNDLQDAADELFLSLWFTGVLVFCAAVYMTGSARYLLPAIPPLVLILFRRLECNLDETSLRRNASANLALSGSLALLLSLADYQFSAIYRDFASVLRRSHSSRDGGLWFTGEWGFRAYLEQAGGQELGRRDPRPKPGDLLIIPSLATPYQTLFSDNLSLDSVAMVAPSRVIFDIPPVPSDGVLVYTLGMPFYDKSDGMDFSVRFVSPDVKRVLRQGRLLPSNGRRWQVEEVPLKDIAGKHGSIVFEAELAWIFAGRKDLTIWREGVRK